jgi:hypothetical protein
VPADDLTLRSVAWDGPAPAAGDLLAHPDLGHLLVQAVAAGPGIGQWRLQCRVPRVIAWHPASWA